MITAKEFFKEELSGEPLIEDSVIEGLVNFAKLHIAEALKIAAIKGNIEHNGYDWTIDEKSLILAYPLELVK